MASSTQCLASLARLSLRPATRPVAQSPVPRLLAASPSQSRLATVDARPRSEKPKVKLRDKYKVHRKTDLMTFSLCDAIRYIRAFEVGQPAKGHKYELAIKIEGERRARIIRNRVQMPHPFRTEIKIAVVCKENSKLAQEAKRAGAIAAGDASIFNSVKDGTYQFTRLICHTDALPLLQKANLGRILGPKGLMPSEKTGTVTKNVMDILKEMTMSEDYREVNGVIRVCVGQLGFTPQMLSDNIKATMASIKADLAAIEGKQIKKLDEIVLSSTIGPGFSLSGSFAPTDEAITPEHLSGEL